jgi:hypothetical protein
MERPVRVRYYRDSINGGWSYEVLAADSLRHLGSGWSAGKKRDAVDAFRQAARSRGWVTEETRSNRMRGAA